MRCVRFTEQVQNRCKRKKNMNTMRENDPVKFLPVIVYRLEEKGDTVHLDTQSVDQTRDPNSQVNTNPV